MTARVHVCDGRDLSCFGCAEAARTQDLVRAAMTRDDRLDDLTRTRIWNALESQLAPAVARPPRRFAVPLAIGGAAFAAAAALVLVLALRPDDSPTLAVADGATLSSPIGPHTRAGLVGPAALDVVRTGPATAIRLRRGTFVADFDGGPDRSLRIEAPGATIEVVGTLFAVEARASASCISVAHGTVRVTTRTITRLVTTGESFCTDTGARPRVPPPIEQLLARHEQSLTASAYPANTMRASGATTSAGTTAPSPTPASTTPPSTSTPPPAMPPPPVAGTTSPSTRSISPTTATTPNQPVARTNTPPPATPTTPPTPPTPTPRVARTNPPSSAPTMPATVPGTSLPRTTSPTASPSSPPVAPPAPPPPLAKPTADELYRTAERALAARDHAAADRALDALITEYPSSPLGEQALYERARMAHQKRAWASARRNLDRLLALPNPRLAEPARYLVCRIAVEAHDGEATSCLVEYRKSYPRSPHDLDVLALLVEREHASGGCRAAAAYIAELSRAHPKTELAKAWQSRCREAR